MSLLASIGARLTAFLVLAIVVLGVALTGQEILARQSAAGKISECEPTLFGRYVDQNSPASRKAVRCAHIQDSLIIWASSELSNAFPNAPYRWFPEQITLPVLAIGKGGHQSMAILAQIAAAGRAANFDRTVILFSPGWLETDGTHIEPFLDHMSEVLQEDYVANQTAGSKHHPSIAAIKNYTDLYQDKLDNWLLQDHLADRNHLDRFLQQIFSFVHRLFFTSAARLTGTEKPFGILEAPREQSPCLSAPYWAHQREQARNAYAKLATNNTMGIRDRYFSRHLAGTTLPKAGKAVADIDTNREAQHLLALLAYLDSLRAQTLVVFLPLKTGIYENTPRLRQLSDELAARARDYKFAVLDLWPQADEMGVLQDPMHVGPVGWQYINEAIYQTYLEPTCYKS